MTKNKQDFGVMLVELMTAVGDELSNYQEMLGQEALLDTSRRRTSTVEHSDAIVRLRAQLQQLVRMLNEIDEETAKPDVLADNTSEPHFELLVCGEEWTRVASFDDCGSDDRVYIVDAETGSVKFGDGKHGETPPDGSRISAAYRYGLGVDGNVDDGPTIALAWTSASFRNNEVIGAIIEPEDNGIIFRVCRESGDSHRLNWREILSKNIKRWALRLICRYSLPR